jgi:ABC-2 type transport system permease protein
VSALVIARTELLRLLRDRSNLFFVFIFPLLLVVLIGSAFGGGMDQRLGVVAPDDASDFVDALEAIDGVAVVLVDDEEELTDRVARGGLVAGVLVPDEAGWESGPRGDEGEVVFVARGDGTGQGLRALVDAAVTERAAVLDAARLAASTADGPAAQHLEVARELQATLPGVEVRAEEVGGDELAREFAGLGQFDQGASSQLFLFTFLTSLAAAGALIQSRQLGVARRMLATPTSTTSVLVGFGAGRLVIAVTQAAYIVGASVLLFRVDWGSPVPTTVVVLAFCLVAGGAGMLVGATMRNDSQAAGVGLGVALGMAALGGSMVPLEVFPEGLRLVAHVTPHAWANEAMAEIVRRDGDLASVAVEVGVLMGYAAVLYALAVWRLRRTLSG